MLVDGSRTTEVQPLHVRRRVSYYRRSASTCSVDGSRTTHVQLLHTCSSTGLVLRTFSPLKCRVLPVWRVPTVQWFILVRPACLRLRVGGHIGGYFSVPSAQDWCLVDFPCILSRLVGSPVLGPGVSMYVSLVFAPELCHTSCQ